MKKGPTIVGPSESEREGSITPWQRRLIQKLSQTSQDGLVGMPAGEVPDNSAIVSRAQAVLQEDTHATIVAYVDYLGPLAALKAGMDLLCNLLERVLMEGHDLLWCPHARGLPRLSRREEGSVPSRKAR